MKKLYFDTSYLFRVYSTEAGHESVKCLLSGCDVIASAWHARAEFASILLRQRREGKQPPELLKELHQQFLDEMMAGHIKLLPLSEPVMLRLEFILHNAPATTNLRAADALHLACAAEHGFSEVYSNDRLFLQSAQLFGLRGINVIS